MAPDPFAEDVSPLRALVTPRMLGVHVIGVLAVSIALIAGVWQYDAWAQRREAEARDLSQSEPVALLAVMDGDDPFPGQDLGRPVELTGQWRTGETFFVADRDDPRQDPSAEAVTAPDVGWWVVTPVSVDGTDSAIPVVRGWVDAPTDPAPPADGTRVDVVGWLQPSEGSGIVDEDPHDDVLPELRIASLTQRVGIDLFSGYVVAREVDGAELTDTDSPVAVGPSDLPEVGVFTALRNLLYAIEWWVFAAFAAFIWWRFGRDEVIAARELAEQDSADGDDPGDEESDATRRSTNRPVGSTS